MTAAKRPSNIPAIGLQPSKAHDPCLGKAPKSLPNVPNTPEEKGKKSVCVIKCQDWNKKTVFPERKSELRQTRHLWPETRCHPPEVAAPRPGLQGLPAFPGIPLSHRTVMEFPWESTITHPGIGNQGSRRWDAVMAVFLSFGVT